MNETYHAKWNNLLLRWGQWSMGLYYYWGGGWMSGWLLHMISNSVCMLVSNNQLRYFHIMPQQISMHILANCPSGFYIVPTPTVKRLGIHLVQKSCIQQLSLICISLSLEIKAHNQGKENGCFQKWKGDNPLVATCLFSCI